MLGDLKMVWRYSVIVCLYQNKTEQNNNKIHAKEGRAGNSMNGECFDLQMMEAIFIKTVGIY